MSARLLELQQQRAKLDHEIALEEKGEMWAPNNQANFARLTDVRQRETESQAGLGGRSYSIEERIREMFTYHPPTPEDQQRYETIRDAAHHLALVIVRNTPFCSDSSAAIRLLRESVMTANAAIACKGVSI